MVVVKSVEGLLSIPTVLLSFTSVFSCLYVIISISQSGFLPFRNARICCFKVNQAPMQSPKQKVAMKNIIFFMCITDLCQALQILFNWIPLAFSSPFWSGTGCKILGMTAQFFAIQSPLWHCMLAYNLGYLVIYGSVNAINNLTKQRYCQYLIIIFVPTLCCIIPIVFDSINVYGIYINNNLNDKECWLTKEPLQLVFVIAILLSLIFHYIVLGTMCFKWYKNISTSQQYMSIIKRLMRFVIVYTIVRFLPAMDRIWECTTTKSPPLWLVLSHHICISSVGIANAIAWKINQQDKDVSSFKRVTRKPLLKPLQVNVANDTHLQQSNHDVTSENTITSTINLDEMSDQNVDYCI
eukprot:127210_1